MGTWGVNINENDEYYDTIELCNELRRKGYSFAEIEKTVLLAKNKSPEWENSLFALADYLWSNNALSKKLFQTIKDVSNTDVDKSVWIELGLTQDQYVQRKQAINRFLHKIQKAVIIKPPQRGETVYTKGNLFWYKCRKEIYGGIVLDYICDYELYLIALSEAITVSNKIDAGNILNSKLYTLAWFSVDALLPLQRIHTVECINVDDNYIGYCGLSVDKHGTLSISNCGSLNTWNHQYYSLRLVGRTIESIIHKKQLPKTYFIMRSNSL